MVPPRARILATLLGVLLVGSATARAESTTAPSAGDCNPFVADPFGGFLGNLDSIFGLTPPAPAQPQPTSLADLLTFPLMGSAPLTSTETMATRARPRPTPIRQLAAVDGDDRRCRLPPDRRLLRKYHRHQHLSDTEFIYLIAPFAQRAEELTGVPASVTIAQAIQETGFPEPLPPPPRAREPEPLRAPSPAPAPVPVPAAARPAPAPAPAPAPRPAPAPVAAAAPTPDPALLASAGFSPTLQSAEILRTTIAALGTQVQERDDIARIVLQYALQRYRRAALFVIKKEMLVGWEGGGSGLARSAIRGIMVPLTNPSIFKTVWETKVLYCGGVPHTTVNDIFFNALGSPRPERVIVVPFVLKDKVACVLYADGGDIEQENPSSISELYQLGRAVSSAFENLILRTKRGG